MVDVSQKTDKVGIFREREVKNFVIEDGGKTVTLTKHLNRLKINMKSRDYSKKS